ncbi:MAG TPA: FAD-linked oxidase C-terminal domain-containing protein, partial [Pseudomonadales bacterium]|nr:FAD-linked oxidase C-terminal domain-containing protein [Pseudomonadales bacterium]
ECVRETQEDLKNAGLYGPIVGHVGDGNFHVVLYCDRSDPDEVKRVKAFYTKLINRAIADDPPLNPNDGGVIREGFSAELDEFRERVKQSPGEVQIEHRPGYSGGGATGGWLAGLLALLAAVRCFRRRA